MLRLALLLALAAAPAAAARAQTTWLQCVVASPCKVWHGTATTGQGGGWSVTFPSGIFSGAPRVSVQAVSTDTTLAASAQATVTARSGIGASGLVTVPATVVVGGLPVMAAGAGVPVDVVAVGP